MTKYIFVSGGVVSGLGKGITAASLGRLLKARGLKVAAQKLDPYINVDPGTMSPFQHGEVFVTEDGAETDLDLGHYERFIDEDLNQFSNLTTGKVYWNILNKERRGEFLGETVQVGLEQDTDDVLYIHVTLVPYLSGSFEHKSKPTQHSVKELQGMGIHPDIIVLRCDRALEESIFKKIALFCNVKEDCVIENLTVPQLYEAPLMLEKHHFSDIVCRELKLSAPQPDMEEWNEMLERIHSCRERIVIGLVGKYVQLHDAYLSVAEALRHAGYAAGCSVSIEWIDSEELTETNVSDRLRGCDGILVPGGFGERGCEGMLLAARYCREHRKPYLGICLGMQIAVIEFARNVCGWKDANSREFDPDSNYRVIDFLPDQNDEIHKGGTLRLGAYPCQIKEGSRMMQCYGKHEIHERHRHRYEFNNDFRDQLETAGLCISGTSPDGHIVETVEISDHPFYVGVQFHPEFKSRPNRPHPLFCGLINASMQAAHEQESDNEKRG